MVSYMLEHDGSETIILSLEADELVAIATGVPVEVPLSDLAEVRDEEETLHLSRTTLVVLGPGSQERLLRAAVEARDNGVDAQIYDRREPRVDEA